MELRFNIKEEVLDTNVFSGILHTEVAANLDTVIYGEIAGLIGGGEFRGDAMVRMSDIEQNPEHLRGALIPARFTSAAYDFPKHDEEGNVREFLVYAFTTEGRDATDVLHCMIASAKSYGRAVQEAYAHGELMKARGLSGWIAYQIVQSKTMKLIATAKYCTNDLMNSWHWQN